MESEIKISQMPGTSSIDGTELIPIVKNGVNQKITINQLLSFLNNNLAVNIAGASINTPLFIQNIDSVIKYNKPFSVQINTDTTYPINTFHSLKILAIGGDIIINTGQGDYNILENDLKEFSFDTLNSNLIIFKIPAGVYAEINGTQQS